jgi:WD40 repeat protein
MTASDRFDRLLADALEDLAAPTYPDYFDDVLERAVRRSQRPAWTFPERWLPMSTATRRTVFAPAFPWRTVAILLAVLALLIAAMVVAIGSPPDMTPAPAFGPADNGSITYTVDGDLYTRDSVTGAERLVVGGPEFDVYPFFSRDGTMLAFFRATGEGAEEAAVMVANADGSDVRELLGPSPIYNAVWSPTSTELAIVTQLDGGPRSLVIVPIEEGAPIQTLDLDVRPSGELEWRAPDGREIIFRANLGALYAIYSVKPDGSDLQQLTDKRNSDYYWGAYAMSPDGTELAYTNGADGQVTMRILNLDTQADRLWGAALPPPEAGWTGTTHWGSPVYSADGTKFVFVRYWDDDGTRINHQVWVATVASDGADAVPVGVVHRSQGGVNPFGYGFAPDDTRVVIQDTDIRQTWIADPAGGEPEPLD